MNPTDTDLLRDMRHGNAQAFTQLYERYQGPIYRFALLRTGSPSAAEDVVQEVFMALLEEKLRFDPGLGSLGGFLLGVTRHFCLKRESTQRRWVSHNAVDDEGTEDAPNPAFEAIAGVEDGPETKLLASQQAEAVRGALTQLPPHYRDVVILYEIHELPYAEIAHICGIDLGTVRSRLSRGRAQLAHLLRLTCGSDKPLAATL